MCSATVNAGAIKNRMIEVSARNADTIEIGQRFRNSEKRNKNHERCLKCYHCHEHEKFEIIEIIKNEKGEPDEEKTDSIACDSFVRIAGYGTKKMALSTGEK